MQEPDTLFEGKYEILAKIREGGMGAIYKVRHRLLDEIRVVKVVRPMLGADETLKLRFSEEARTATRLKHPNIATVYDFAIDDDGTAYLVMEFIDGVNLLELLRSQGPPKLSLTLEIAHQTLLALGYLHRKNFVHRDVAPDNLMLTTDEEGRPLVKLIDLGIAKALDRQGELTSTGMFLGKVKYASPEQFGVLPPGERLDGRSDLFAFGIVLYELTTGLRPFEGETPIELMRSHVAHPPIPFSETDPGGRVPEGLRPVVLKALAKNREERFASAEEFDRSLAELRAQFPLAQDQEATAVIASTAQNIPTVPNSPVSSSAQVRLNQNLAGRTPAGTLPPTLATPPAEPSVSPAVERSGPAVSPVRSYRNVALVAAVLAVVAVAAFLVVRSRSGAPETGSPSMESAAVRSPPPTLVSAATPAPSSSTSASAVPPPESPTASPASVATPVPAAAAIPSPEPRVNPAPTRRPAAAVSPAANAGAVEAARRSCEKARSSAKRAHGDELAAARFSSGVVQEEEADRLWKQGNLEGARVAFELAESQFANAEKLAAHAPRLSPTATPEPAPLPAEARRAAEETARLCGRARGLAMQARAGELAPDLFGRASSREIEGRRQLALKNYPAALSALNEAIQDYDHARSQAAARPGAPGSSFPTPIAGETGRRPASEEGAIRETLRAFAQAQSALDADLYFRVYPSADRERVRTEFQSLRSQRVDFAIQSIAVTSRADKAVARVTETRISEPRSGVRQNATEARVIQLQKTQGAWVITSTGFNSGPRKRR